MDTTGHAEKPLNRRGGQYRHHSAESSRAFGAALALMMESWGYNPDVADDAEAFLEHIRAAQQPPRHFPYAPCVLDALLKGELLPDNAMLHACIAMTQAKHDDALEAMLDACDTSDGLRRGRSCAAFTTIAKLLSTNKNAPGDPNSLTSRILSREPTLSPGRITNILKGFRPLTPEIAKHIGAAIDERLPPPSEQNSQAHEALKHAGEAKAGADIRAGRANEFSILLKHCIEHSGWSTKELADKLFNEHESQIGSLPHGHGIVAHADKPLSGACISQWITAISTPSAVAVKGLRDILMRAPNVAADARLLPAAYDELLQQKAASLWQQAADTNQPGLLLQACRERFGQNLSEFSSGKVKSVMWFHYEKNVTPPPGSHKKNARIPSKEPARAALAEHVLTATTRAADAYAAELGITPRPWMLEGEDRGLARSTAWPMTPVDEKIARQRYETLKQEFIKNPALNFDARVNNRVPSGR